MNTQKSCKVFLVDDDELFLKSLEIEFLLQGEFNIETFATGELCIKQLASKPDIIILDYHLDGVNSGAMNGMETLDQIKAFDKETTVIMLSSQDKIDVAVDCMHHGATNYVVKSETAFIRLQKIITDIFKVKKLESVINWYSDRI